MKLSRALAELVGIARTETAAAKIEAALAAARDNLAAALDQHDAIEKRYHSTLLDASPADLAKLLDARTAATVDVDRAEALITVLQERLDATRAQDERDRLRRLHHDAEAQATAMRERLARDYPRLAGELRVLLRDLAAAKVAADRANAEAAEFGYIPDPETVVRGDHAVPEEVLSERVVQLWQLDGQPHPLPPDRQGEVTVDASGRGYRQHRGHVWYAQRRTFRERKVAEGFGHPFLSSLLEAVCLPGLNRWDDDIVRLAHSDAESAARNLAGPAQVGAPPTRKTLVRHEPLPDQAPDAGGTL